MTGNSAHGDGRHSVASKGSKVSPSRHNPPVDPHFREIVPSEHSNSQFIIMEPPDPENGQPNLQ